MDPDGGLAFDAYEQSIDDCVRLLDRRSAVTLDEIALALSAVLQPRLDRGPVLAELDRLANECPDRTPTGVVRHLVGTAGFRGAENYDDWRNSCLDHVLERRAGIPITLAIVAIEVGRRCGLELAGIGMPMHFLVGDRRDPDWFADVFVPARSRAGTDVILDRAGCRHLFERLGRATWAEEFLDPVDPRQIALRMLNNLRAHCAVDPIRLALVMRLRSRLPEFDDDLADAVRAAAILN